MVINKYMQLQHKLRLQCAINLSVVSRFVSSELGTVLVNVHMHAI